MQKEVKTNTYLSNAFTSFYIYNNSKFNKGNKSIVYISNVKNNEINQYINKENRLRSLKDKNKKSNKIFTNSKNL